MITDTVDWRAVTVSVYAAMFEDRVHFAQAAYRDGEWACILGWSGGNCNGEKYDPALGALLRQTLLEPVGQWCVFWWPHPAIGVRARKQAIEWIAQHKPPVRWIPDRPVGRANEQGVAAPLFAAIRTRRVILVGPKHLSRLSLFPVAKHVVAPDAIAWKHADRICAEVLEHHEPDDLVLFASGMASNVMIHRLWPALRGRATLYDIGAALDPYVGRLSRGEFQRPEWAETARRNTPE